MFDAYSQPGPPRAQFAGGNPMPIAIDALRSPLPQERVDVTAPKGLSLLLIQLMASYRESLEKRKRGKRPLLAVLRV